MHPRALFSDCPPSWDPCLVDVLGESTLDNVFRQLVTYPDRSSYLIIAHLIVDPHFLAQNDEKHRIS